MRVSPCELLGLEEVLYGSLNKAIAGLRLNSRGLHKT